MTISEAQSLLEAQGLHVSRRDNFLFIAGSYSEIGGVGVSNDACLLFLRDNKWFIAFPTQGLMQREIEGALTELTSLLIRVYSTHKSLGISLRDSFDRILKRG